MSSQATLVENKNTALAQRLLSENRIGEALTIYQAVLEKNNSHLDTLVEYGVALRASGHFSEACYVYKKALELDPNLAFVWSNLGNALKDANNLASSIEAHQKALVLQKDNSGFWVNYGLALREACNFQQALQAFQRAKFLRYPQPAMLDWELALTYLAMNEYKAAWPYYKYRFAAKKIQQPEYTIKKWNGQSLEEKTLLVFEEQGFGDVIFSARLLRRLEKFNCKVKLVCRKVLHRVFSEIKNTELFDIDSKKEIDADYYCYLMDLFDLLAINQPDSIPTLIHIPDESKAKFNFIEKDKAKAKIGIIWSGSLTFAGNHKRAVPLDFFNPLLSLPEVSVYSLQKGPKEAELLQSPLRPFITNLAPRLGDFADTAAAIEKLDMIIMTDSSVAHLAASMGKRVINLLQFQPYWIYGAKEDTSPWYPSMKLIRQPNPGDWPGVQKKMMEFLVRFLHKR